MRPALPVENLHNLSGAAKRSSPQFLNRLGLFGFQEITGAPPDPSHRGLRHDMRDRPLAMGCLENSPILRLNRGGNC